MTAVIRTMIGVMLAIGLQSCIVQTQPAAPKPAAFPDIYVPSGTTTPALSMGFEANYDPKLDSVIPGYKIVTVAVTNASLDYLQMDPLTDQWWVIGRGKSKHKAILTLRDKDPDAWATLPQRLRQLIEYPLLIRIGESATIDLLLPAGDNLNEYREVVFRSTSLKKTIHIIPRE